MPNRFTGFPPQAFTFFRQLEKNNKREWFQPRKEIYETQVRGPMLALVELLNEDLRSFAADHVTPPNKSVYRIYRDTRFSKDKTPYKTHVAALFPRRGMAKHAGGGFYFQVTQRAVEVAGGVYMPGPEEQLAVRQAIADEFDAFRKLVTARPLVRLVGPLQGSTLARVPRGFDADHPAADYLRMKNWYFDVELPVDVARTPGIRKEVLARFKAMAPLVHWLNNAILSRTQGAEAVDETPRRPEPMF